MRFGDSRHPEVRAIARRRRAFLWRASKGDGACGHPSRPAFGRHLRMTAVAFALLISPALAADELPVSVENASEPILCAEKDNVYVKFTSPEVKRFSIEAVHPNYIGTIVTDRSAFDLNNCPDLAAAPYITEQPQRHTIFETPDLQLVGLTIPNFWRISSASNSPRGITGSLRRRASTISGFSGRTAELYTTILAPAKFAAA